MTEGDKMFKKLFFTLLSIVIVAGILQAQENPQEELNLLEQIAAQGDFQFRNFEVVLEFPQPIDHNNPDGTKFKQRVFIKHKDFSKPVVFHTRGYFARPGSETELSKILNCNEIEVEHRYFAPSAPDSIEWQFLTTAQAAADFHAVAQFLKQYYKGKWISTGASKGGQTALFQEYYYPEDADVVVAYVAPLNLAEEDERIPAYLADSISTPEARERMLNCQRALLERRDEIMPLVMKGLEESNTEFAGDPNVCYEYGVFETSFSWWQYGSGNFEDIPLPDASAEDLYKFLQNGITFFYKSFNDYFIPFNYQGYTELGFYGYDTTPFEDLLEYVDTDWASNRPFLVKEDWDISFNPEVMNNVHDFLMSEGNNIIYIYGEYDPWTSTGVWPNPETNAIRMTMPAGNHGTNILAFEGEEREKLISALEEWLDLKIDRRRLNSIANH